MGNTKESTTSIIGRQKWREVKTKSKAGVEYTQRVPYMVWLEQDEDGNEIEVASELKLKKLTPWEMLQATFGGKKKDSEGEEDESAS